MKFLPIVGINMEAQNQKTSFDISSLVCRLQTKIPKILIFVNAKFRHVDFTNFAGLSTSILETNPKNFKSIVQRLAILQNNL